MSQKPCLCQPSGVTARVPRRPPATFDRSATNEDPVERLARLAIEVSQCRGCERLVEWREQAATDKRAAYAHEEYWGRGVPGFGDPEASILFLGLAPAAHGANRTGRIFTGDRSGEWLYRALHRAGLANQAESIHRDDGLVLERAWVTSAVKCAPPDNKPLPEERDRCTAFLVREMAALVHLRVVVCLGAFAYQAAATHFGIRPRPKFAHGLEVPTSQNVTLVCSFHPSQQNTFTGRLTETMLDDVVTRAVEIAQD